MMNIGREAERKQVAAFIQQADQGRATALVIEGEPGIGKTHLVEHVMSLAAGTKLRVLGTTAREIEREVPFAAALDLLGPDVRKTVARSIAAATETGPELGFRITEALVDAVEERAVEGPMLLVVDDVHWADPSSLVFIDRIGRSLDVNPIALVLSARPVPRSRELEIVISHLTAHGPQLRLLPLDPGDVQTMSESILGTRVGGKLLGQLEKCGGNPFYVQEMLSSLRASIVTQRGVSDIGHVDLHTSMYDTIVERLGFLPRETLSLLRSGSLLGTRFALDDLLVAANLPAIEVLELLEPAARSGVVELEGAEARFKHDLVREALHRSIPESARASLHRDLVGRFSRAGRPPTSIAPHVLLSAEEGDPDALDVLRRAAIESAPQAPGLAADLLSRAVDVAGRAHPERYEIEAELTKVLVWAGRAEEAERLSRRLLAESRGGSHESIVRRAFLDALFLQGTLGRSLHDIETVIPPDHVSPLERAPILVRAAGAFVIAGDLARGEELAVEGMQLADETREHAALSAALTTLARIASIHGDVKREKDLLERAAALALGSGGPSAATEAVPILAYLIARLEGRTEQALGLLREGLELCERGSLVWAAWWMHAGLGVVLYESGRLDDAASSLETALRIADEAGTHLLIPAIAAHLAHIEALRGEMGRAERHLSLAQRESQRQSDSNIAPDFDVLWARASVDELLRQDERAAAALEILRKRAISGPHNLLIEYVRCGLTHVRVATRLEDERQAQDALEAVEQGVAILREGFPVEPWTSAYMALCQGISRRDVRLLQESCDTIRPLGRPLLLALAAEETGRLMCSEDRAKGIDLLEEARELWSRSGAVTKVRRLDADLRRMGIPGRYRGRSTRPRRGWEALTETESHVADLVAKGLTYRAIGERLFISKRTVETHVAHIFEKLEVSSRAELAALEAFGRSRSME